MTAKAVKGAGNGDRMTGARRMYEIMNGLQRKGFIHIDKGKARAIYPMDVWHKLRDHGGAEIEKTQ